MPSPGGVLEHTASGQLHCRPPDDHDHHAEPEHFDNTQLFDEHAAESEDQEPDHNYVSSIRRSPKANKIC